MILLPVYNLLVLPDVTFYFQNGYIDKLTQEKPEKDQKVLFLLLREEKDRENLALEDFYPIGVTGTITGTDEDGNVSIETEARVEIDTIEMNEGRIDVTYLVRDAIEDMDEQSQQEEFKKVQTALLQYISKFQWGILARSYVVRWKTLEEMAAALSYQMNLTGEEKYRILEADKISERHELIRHAVYEFIEMSKVSVDVQKAQTESHEKLYREEAIRKQMALLQNELDKLHPESMTDIRKFEMKIQESGMNETARKEAEKILNRMRQEGENSHEYGMLYDYLDFVTSLSWKKENFESIDLKEAERILDEEHYGLHKVKTRIIQQIAGMKLRKKQSGSILLFVGAPGTGKTSIGQSIAKALGRKYVRVSLGGIRDEAEIRGHRRTYIGAMPGRIMEGMKRSGVSNPVMVLDEVDKLTKAFDGDPSSALLEVLDPEQNHTFTDHYMNVPYDLSDVLFICTANSTDTIPEPLLNRMEEITFSGYTELEKMQIARKHLLPKSMEGMGIPEGSLEIGDELLHKIIADYTMEAGVRGLKKRLDAICRSAAVRLVRGEETPITIREDELQQLFDMNPLHHEQVFGDRNPGIVTGLAWTQAGGDILFIEAMFVKGKGEILITGQLGDVMKESAQIAVSLVKHLFPEKAGLFEENDLHIHVPAGAVPKDGPSAGITLTTALASLVTGHRVSSEYAMTGEVSLQGRVMPIGGLPEKLMAAVRAGVKTVLIPEENKGDLSQVAEEVKEKLTILPVKQVTDVLEITGILNEH
ncbi:MAG TPA: endopeptidase La [Candidatus Blautia gallistercoris]|uniref:endopeptidase La n=1 Tax=Candidatus Blautia gallistercoris TaxID=2838490 RepID=A0A9D1WJK6_9FIRM|nr:endopeptidase La [Candidatus Blautia gallistercoris]